MSVEIQPRFSISNKSQDAPAQTQSVGHTNPGTNDLTVLLEEPQSDKEKDATWSGSGSANSVAVGPTLSKSSMSDWRFAEECAMQKL